MYNLKCKHCQNSNIFSKKRNVFCKKCGNKLYLVSKKQVKIDKSYTFDQLDNFILPELAEVLEITHKELLLLMKYDKKWLIEELKRRGIL